MEIPNAPHPHRAHYDEQGNIVLPGAHAMESSMRLTAPCEMQEGVWHTATGEDAAATSVWEIDETLASELTAPLVTEVVSTYGSDLEADEPEQIRQDHWVVIRDRIADAVSSVLSESNHQYTTSARSARDIARDVRSSLLRTGQAVWCFLTQPVWVPGRNRTPKQYNRGILFLLDTVRFGGTFAALFAILFVSLNYQSFWAIAESYVAPLAEVTGGIRSNAIDSALAENLKHLPALTTAGYNDQGLLALLPPVGPPENRLIIPKLNLNIPIVIPPSDALLQEDWKRLEEDIQEGLQSGVVHYPGTARPGQAGNFFVTGHSSFFPWAPGNFKSVFARLHELNVGDEYWVFYGGDRHRYVIQDEKEIKPSDVSVLDQPVNRRIGTLMTCTPVGTTLRRLILTAQEVDPITGIALEVGERSAEDTLPKVRMEMLPI